MTLPRYFSPQYFSPRYSLLRYSLLQYSSPQYGLLWLAALGCLALLSVTASGGEVKRWQDKNGQWHFGADATAPRHARPVTIDRKISIVAGPAAGSTATDSNRRAVDRRPAVRDAYASPVRPRAYTRAAEQERPQPPCAQWRAELDRLRLTLSNGSRDYYRELSDRYDRQCVLGQR